MADPWWFEALADRPPPFAGECLSGYLLRLAQVNGFTYLWDLLGDVFPLWRHPQQMGLLGWEYPLEGWGRLPVRTQLSEETLKGLTVYPWVEKFRLPPDRTRTRYLSPAHFLRGVVLPALRVCPVCLQEEPFLRLLWRLAPMTACGKHGCFLQERCTVCGARLTAVSQTSRHLRCATCGADLRRLVGQAAPERVVAEQCRLASSLGFLLDPTVTLSQGVPDRAPGEGYFPAQAVGLKFHYQRAQQEQSLPALARQLGVGVEMLSRLERGQPTPLTGYGAYLEALGSSWPNLANLKVPLEFVREVDSPRRLALRVCPNPDCPNHTSPGSLRVTLRADLPERRAARFHCTDCGRNFTRAFDGALLTKPRRPSIRPGDPPTVPKTSAEIVLLKQWGLQGEDNRQIAHHLGWGEKTVRMYWIALDLEVAVHQAQAERREREKQDRQAALRTRLEQVLPPMLEQNQEISLRRVGRALGCNSDYLHCCPDLLEWAERQIGPHNAGVRQSVHTATTVRILQAMEEMKASERIVKAEELAQKAGLTYGKLREVYPELLPTLHSAIVEHRVRLEADKRQDQIARIDAAGARLTERGVRLNYKAILQEAGLSPYASKSPVIRDALIRWTGIFAPRD